MEPEQTRRRKGCLAALAPGLVLLILLVLLWSARKPIARHFVDRELAVRGVPARYAFGRLGVLEQRLDHVVIGDPRAPDLTADWAVIRLGWGLSGPTLRGARASGVRLRGRLVDGRLSLGALDRLLPPPSNAPFALPDLDVDLDDTRMRLDTPAGRVGLSLYGKGNLADGFAGTLGAVASDRARGGCRASGATAFLKVTVRKREPMLTGPVRASEIACAGGRVTGPWVQLAATLSPALDRWRGAAGVALVGAASGGSRIGATRGRIDFAGDAGGTVGTLALDAAAAESPRAKSDRLALNGRYEVASDRIGFTGHARAAGASVAREALWPALAALPRNTGTPLDPLARAVADAAARAATRFDADADIAFSRDPRGGRLRVARLDAESASGARAVLAGGDGASWSWGGDPGGRIDGAVRLSGGGFPTLRLALRRAPGGGLAGEGEMAPFAAGGARLALASIRLAPAPGGGTGFAARPTLDGPLADGRIAGLSLPLAGTFAPGAFLLNPRCAPLSFTSLEIASTRIGPSRLTLCPAGAALLAKRSGGAMTGGGAIAGPRLTGRVGAQPLTLAAQALRFDVGHPGFALRQLAVRLGTGEAVTRLDVPLLEGAARGGLSGRFADAGGAIANVPLLLSAANGRWRLAGGVLALDGALAVADAGTPPRFERLVSDDVRLTLKGGAIAASGTLKEPKTRRAIAAVTLHHALASGRGGAVLAVPGIAFDEKLQPEALTRLTLGVVANVAGTVAGRGDIRWGREGVASTGDFHTDKLDLAAAFGPVTGLKGTIHFSDLLGLRTPPGQRVTLGAVNPGVEVSDGIVTYQLLGDEKVGIESGRWAFVGGTLVLESTLLDFGAQAERRFTFRVAGLDAAQFIERFKLENIAATGAFDGVLPIVFDAKGGRIEGGRLVVQRGGGRLSYVGDVSNAQLGTFGKLAFDALKSIRYESLEIDLDGALDGEIVSRIGFTGVNDAPTPAQKPKGLLKNLTGLPFKFNIVVRAPFRGLLNSASTFANPASALKGQAAPAAPVQPPESGGAR